MNLKQESTQVAALNVLQRVFQFPCESRRQSCNDIASSEFWVTTKKWKFCSIQCSPIYRKNLSFWKFPGPRHIFPSGKSNTQTETTMARGQSGTGTSFFQETFGFVLSVSVHQYCILIFTCMLFLPAG